MDKAKSDSFLGAQIQIVKEQTVNKQKSITMGSSQSLAPHSNSPLTHNSSKTQNPSKNLSRDTSKNPSAKTNSPSLSKLGVPMVPAARSKDVDEPEWATPGTRPEDYVQGIRESDRTALNTQEYKFYSYFQRIRERLDRAWVPILREKLIAYYRSGRQLASDMDHTTRVMVVLNGTGEIVRVQLVSESGTKDLDEAAIGAFNRAGPFPNPPRGIVDNNKEIKIPWEFILKS